MIPVTYTGAPIFLPTDVLAPTGTEDDLTLNAYLRVYGALTAAGDLTATRIDLL